MFKKIKLVSTVLKLVEIVKDFLTEHKDKFDVVETALDAIKDVIPGAKKVLEEIKALLK